MNTLTVLPFLLAMAIAVAAMPTDVVQVNAWGLGHEHTMPWKSRAMAALKGAAASLTWFGRLWRSRTALTSLAFLLALLAAQAGLIEPAHAAAAGTGLAVVGDTTLADVKAAIEGSNRAFEDYKRTNDERHSTLADAMAVIEGKVNKARIGGGFGPGADSVKFVPSMREYNEQRALTIGSDPGGGYLTQTEIGPIVSYLKAKSIIMQMGPRVFPMTQARMELPKLTGSSTVYHVGEGGTITSSSPSLGRVALQTYAYAARVVASAEWFDDVNEAARQLLSADIRDQLALKYDRDCLEGDGTSLSPIVGLRHIAGITQTEVAAGSGNGGAVALVDIINAIDRLERNNAVPSFIAMHPRTWGSLRKIEDQQDRLQLTPDPSQEAARRLFGLPVLLSSQISITETQGSNADCSYVIVGDATQLAVGLRAQFVTIIDPYSLAGSRQTQIVTASLLAFNILNTEAVEIIKGVRAA